MRRSVINEEIVVMLLFQLFLVVEFFVFFFFYIQNLYFLSFFFFFLLLAITDQQSQSTYQIGRLKPTGNKKTDSMFYSILLNSLVVSKDLALSIQHPFTNYLSKIKRNKKLLKLLCKTNPNNNSFSSSSHTTDNKNVTNK